MKEAVQILRIIHEVMTSDSIFLLDENFVPTKAASLYNAEFEFSSLSPFASMECTKNQWIALLEASGLNTRDYPVICRGSKKSDSTRSH
jgi:hypothetical protein